MATTAASGRADTERTACLATMEAAITGEQEITEAGTEAAQTNGCGQKSIGEGKKKESGAPEGAGVRRSAGGGDAAEESA